MEPVRSFSDEEFHSLSTMVSNVDTDFMLQLHGHDDIYFNDRQNLFGNETSRIFSTDEINNIVEFFDHKSLFSSSNYTYNTNNCNYISPESNNSNGIENVYFPNSSNNVNFLHVTNDTTNQSSMEFYVMDEKITNNPMVPVLSDDPMEDILKGKEESVNGDPKPTTIVTSCKPHELKRKSEFSEDLLINESSDHNPKKKSSARKYKKNKKISQDCITENDDHDKTNNVGQTVQSCSVLSEDNSNASQESADLKSKGKTRANRGCATDSQSIYARKRRERINERLRILQNLVPNGTKVDISTMLEEAVEYVKFLQLQIQLLSSDDLWMYAPIAYNGMDIGSYQKILPYL